MMMLEPIENQESEYRHGCLEEKKEPSCGLQTQTFKITGHISKSLKLQLHPHQKEEGGLYQHRMMTLYLDRSI